MSADLKLSRRDAWTRVLRYVGGWLFFWLLLGLGGTGRVELLNEQVPANVAMPSALVEQSMGLRGPVQRVEQANTDIKVVTAEDGRFASEVADTTSSATAAIAQGGLPVVGDPRFFATAPAGFADLAGIQNTQADVYFQGRQVTSSFIEYDLEHVWFLSPVEVVQAIPTLENPAQVLAAISGELDSNSQLLCNRRVRENCGVLDPAVAGIIFDEGKFRIDLFIHQDQLAVQMLVGERYLPAPSAGWATLHDMGLTASGQQGRNSYTLSGESFLSKGSGRVRVRYGLTNTGPSVHEASWQWDNRDREFELGVFRGARGNSLFINDKRLLGFRLGSSTKTRTDLDNALATPILIFLERRSRVDILRDNEVLDSRFYDAGNHQLDTTRLPDGAYDIRVRTVSADGQEDNQQHFFVRNSLLPPLGESQYYLEAGAFTEDYGSDVPRTVGGGWLRGGLSHRLNEKFAFEGEMLLSRETSLLQGGAYALGPGWQVHAGAMASARGDTGYSLRGQLQRKRLSFSFNAQHLKSKTVRNDDGRFDLSLTSNVDFSAPVDLTALEEDGLERGLRDSQSVLGGSYTQASAALSFPLEIPLWNGRRSKGQMQVRAQYNQRGDSSAQKGFGLNYNAPLFRSSAIAADWSFDSLYSANRSLVRMGIDFRWRNGRQTSLVRPELVASRSKGSFSEDKAGMEIDPSVNASWNRARRSDRFGDMNEGVYLSHQGDRSVLGGRLASQSNYGYADLDVAYAQGPQQGLQYVANSRFNLVSKDGKSALGGSSQLAAVVVEIDGDLPDSDFAIIVGSRVAGYASTARRGVVSLRPYDTYDVRISPTGDDILGYDQRSYEVTLFPGNVHRLVFSAHEVRVVVSQAIKEDGSPVAYGKFINVDGYGVTDAEGWFQVGGQPHRRLAGAAVRRQLLLDGASCSDAGRRWAGSSGCAGLQAYSGSTVRVSVPP